MDLLAILEALDANLGALQVRQQPLSALTTGVLSLRGKLRLLAEPFIPAKKDDGDESLADFVTRRQYPDPVTRRLYPDPVTRIRARDDSLHLALDRIRHHDPRERAARLGGQVVECSLDFGPMTLMTA